MTQPALAVSFCAGLLAPAPPGGAIGRGCVAFVARVSGRLGGASSLTAAWATETTLELLGECMPRSDAETLAGLLPAELARALCRRVRGASLDLAEFLALLGRRQGVAPDVARRFAVAVCAVLVADLAAGARVLLPPGHDGSLAALFPPS